MFLFNGVSIYTNPAHQRVIWIVNTAKRCSFNIGFSGVNGKAYAFWCDRPEIKPAFWQTFFLPFQISYRIEKAFIFNKNKGNNKKVENKVSSRDRVGVGRALLSQ